MAAPVFNKRFYDRPDAEFDKAMKTFKAAVAAARAGTDEAIKQVVLLLLDLDFLRGFFPLPLVGGVSRGRKSAA